MSAVRLRSPNVQVTVKMRVDGGRGSQTDALSVCVLAWNAHRAGETRTNFNFRGRLTQANFPEPGWLGELPQSWSVSQYFSMTRPLR
jgi:hypothetical protein